MAMTDNKIIPSPHRKPGIEMAVVCSDLSLLENINALLCRNGVIGIRDDEGTLHYIVDGRHNRIRASAMVTSMVDKRVGDSDNRDDAFFESCIKTIFKEYGLDMSLTGAVVLYDAVKRIFQTDSGVPVSMKSIYAVAAGSYGMTFSQVERDVRYAIKKSRFKDMRSRTVLQCLVTRVGRRLKFGLDDRNVM